MKYFTEIQDSEWSRCGPHPPECSSSEEKKQDVQVSGLPAESGVCVGHICTHSAHFHMLILVICHMILLILLVAK